MPDSFFNKVTGFYPATSLKEGTPTQMFSDEFWEMHKTPFLQNTFKRLLLFYGKIFCQCDSKKPSEKKKEKENKMETACKINNDKRKIKA